jgi:DNA-binding NarL/FixJ family response regulator
MVAREGSVPKFARVIIVDDDDFTRTLVGTLVESFGYEVCAKASAVTEAMARADELRPDLAVLDLDLGEGPTGLDLAHGLRRMNPRIAIVLLTSYGDPTWMGERRDPPAGTRYVIKGSVSDPQVLGDALLDALEHPLSHDGPPRTAMALNEGQWEILRLVAAGHTNAEIARRCSLTEDAVNKAVTRLVRQLDIQPGPSGNVRVLLTRAYAQLTKTVSERRT